MSQATKPIPEGFHTLTPSLTVRGCERALEFYHRALGAEEVERALGPGGKIMHAEMKIGDSIFMLNDEFPEWDCRSPEAYGGTTFGMYVYVDDADSSFQRAIAAGGTVTMPMSDTFWGDRCGAFKDPFGHRWTIATRKETLTRAEIVERQKTAFAQAQQQQQQQ